MSSRSESDQMQFRLIIIFLIMTLGIGLSGYLYYVVQKQHITKGIQEELSAIADLKVSQITAWRYERLEDAMDISKNPLIARAVQQFLQDQGTAGTERDILSWMKSFQEISHLQSILLVDARGRVRLSTSSDDKAIGPHAEQLVQEALKSGQCILSDFHKTSVAPHPHLDLVAPLRIQQGGKNRPIAAFVIRINPETFLYPLIQSWPGSSKSAETLLIRKETDSVLFLNELRYRKDSALSLRIPLDKKRLPASLAIQGATGVFEGLDYRDVPVLAATRSVAQTSWFLVAKVDIDEVYSPLRKQARLLTLVIAVLIASAGLIIIFWWRKKTAEDREKYYESELARKTLSQRYDYLSKYANDIILLSDPDGHILEANDRATAAYGYTRDEMLLLCIRDLRAPETWHDIPGQMQKVREQKGFIFETVHQRNDGTTFPVEVSSRLIDNAGKLFFLSIIRDTTERAKAETALVNEKNRSQAIIAAIGDGISIQDRDFKIIYQNQVDKDLHGDHVGKYCYQAYEQKDQTCEGCALADSFKDGMIHTAERTVQTDRGLLHVELTASPLKNESGEIVAGIEVARNITSRRQMEQSLIENEQRYKRLIQSVTDYIVTIDVENGRAVTTYHSPGCETVTGYTSSEYQADPDLWFRMIFDGDRIAVIEQTKSVLSGALVAPFEHRIIHKDGSLRWVRHTPVSRTDSTGKVVSADSLITDITQLRLLESQLRQAQKMEAVGQLAGGIAHDFNNILTAIIGYSHLIRMKMEEGNPDRPYVEHIIASSERAAHLTQSLLAFSRKQVIDLKPVNLNDIIVRTEHLLGRVIGEDIELRTVLAEKDLPVMADSMHIEQVLMNVAANARDAMPNGGLLLLETGVYKIEEEFIRTHAYGRPGTYACLSITDTGTGMDENTSRRIFEPFFTTKEVGKGTGLGLSMVYGIVKQHHGYIEVNSEPGKGTTFWIYLPLLAKAIVAKPVTAPAEIARGTETVLLAEDDKTVRDLARHVLETSGYRVLEAADGEEAVRIFFDNGNRIDLLVFDVIMPKKNGKDAYLEIKKGRPDIKALFMSGYTANMVFNNETPETDPDVVLKPISPSDFLKKVREILDRR